MSGTYDCIVVGARAAGAATAMLLARQGVRVLVLDDGELGSDTLSTHFIWPRGARRLAEWGIGAGLEAAGTPPIRKVLFEPGCAQIELAPDPSAWCPRRTVLDALLVRAAVAAGAEVRHGVRVTGVLEAGGRVAGVRHRDGEERAALVVGADGRQSTVARAVCADVLDQHPAQTAGFYAYFEGLQVEGAEFWLRAGQLTYLWQTNDGLGLAYVAVSADRLSELRTRLGDGLAAAAVPAGSLQERLAAARQVTRARGFAGQGPLRRQRCGPGWALVGDACSFKDPTAGMGLAEAFEDAAWLATATAKGSLDIRPNQAREVDAARVFAQCRDAARLRAPEPWLTDAYREIAADPALCAAALRWLGGEVAASELLGRVPAARISGC